MLRLLFRGHKNKIVISSCWSFQYYKVNCSQYFFHESIYLLILPNQLSIPTVFPQYILCPWNFPGKNTGVGCHLLLQGIFPTQESKPYLLCFLALAGRFFTTVLPGWYIFACENVSCSSCPTLCDCTDSTPRAPLSMEFSWQEYWSGLPFSSTGDLPDPGIELRSVLHCRQIFYQLSHLIRLLCT